MLSVRTCAAFVLGALIAGAGAASGCAPVAPRVSYRPAGRAADGVFFVEDRGTGSERRQYLVICSSQRLPPCARIAPRTLRTEVEVARWLDTQRPLATAAAPPRISRRPSSDAQAVPMVDDGFGGGPNRGDEGLVNIVTVGGWANVYDDEGRFLGQTPVQLRLREGEHLLSFRPFGQPPGADPFPVVVRAGETISIVRNVTDLQTGYPPSTPAAHD